MPMCPRLKVMRWSALNDRKENGRDSGFRASIFIASKRLFIASKRLATRHQNRYIFPGNVHVTEYEAAVEGAELLRADTNAACAFSLTAAGCSTSAGSASRCAKGSVCETIASLHRPARFCRRDIGWCAAG